MTHSHKKSGFSPVRCRKLQFLSWNGREIYDGFQVKHPGSKIFWVSMSFRCFDSALKIQKLLCRAIIFLDRGTKQSNLLMNSVWSSQMWQMRGEINGELDSQFPLGPSLLSIICYPFSWLLGGALQLLRPMGEFQGESLCERLTADPPLPAITGSSTWRSHPCQIQKQ